MADLPTRFNAALDAVVTQILADITGSVCERVSYMIDDPDQWWEKGSWPDGTTKIFAVIDGPIDEVEPTPVHEYDRELEMRAVIRCWTSRSDNDKTKLSEQRLDDLRRLQNAIETVGAANPFDDGWTVDWTGSVGRVDLVSNQPPYAAFECVLSIKAWE